MFDFGFVFLVFFAFGLFIAAIVRAPRTFNDVPRHVLICCAHSDDCVITGAEYAYGAVQNGLSVRIVYLTCSASEPKSEMAQTRTVEALSAWSALAVPPENLTFIGLSQSPVAGPPSYRDEDLGRAKKVLIEAVGSLPPHASVIIPASGESHVDHRAIRRLALRVVAESRREDLIIYESPEYNDCLSFVHGPIRAARAVIRHLPVLNRVIGPHSGPSNYVCGPPGLIFRDNPDRLAMKRALLTHFVSQNGERLVQSFGHPTLYRRVPLRNPSPHVANKCIPAFGGRCDMSTLCLALVVFGLLFFCTYNATLSLLKFPNASPIVTILPFCAIAVSAAYLLRTMRGTVSIETALSVWVGTFGMLAAFLWVSVHRNVF